MAVVVQMGNDELLRDQHNGGLLKASGDHIQTE